MCHLQHLGDKGDMKRAKYGALTQGEKEPMDQRAGLSETFFKCHQIKIYDIKGNVP